MFAWLPTMRANSLRRRPIKGIGAGLSGGAAMTGGHRIDVTVDKPARTGRRTYPRGAARRHHPPRADASSPRPVHARHEKRQASSGALTDRHVHCLTARSNGIAPAVAPRRARTGQLGVRMITGRTGRHPRECRSSTVATPSLPSPVGISVMVRHLVSRGAQR